jgi:RES domain-containing protein
MKQADPISASRAVGDRWIDAQAALVLVVPSVIFPEEANLILNPAHARMRDVSIAATRPFRFDARLAASRA